MTVVTLSGCRSTPLLSYLQGFGVLRVLHNQHLPGVLSYWKGSTLQLEDTLEGESLVDFFLHQYKPTPILSPWNGRGGFRIREPQKGERAVQTIRDNNDPRFEWLWESIDQARKVVRLAKESGWVDDEGKATAKTKPLLMAACRSVFPDQALEWLDTAFVLSDDSKPNYPLLVGTGGNLGAGDLSTNYLEALDQLLDPKHLARSERLLMHALFGHGHPELEKGLVGQFLPAAAGTVNSSAFGNATSAVNPWSFVLGMEGTLLFASGVARRFKGSRGMATTPFTVPKSPVGYSAADNETVKGEMWLPVWDRPMTVPELRRILAEGRLSWGGKHASHGVDAAKAISTLGVDRGLSRFERYVVATRFGNMTLAVPVASFPVVKQPVERVQLIHDLDPWLNRLRNAKLPASARSAMRRIDTAQMRVVQRSEDVTPLQDLLAEITALEWVVSRNPDLRARARSPVPPLSIDRWAAPLDDGTSEWTLAVSIATQRDRFTRGRGLNTLEQRRGAASCLLRPVKLHADPHRSHQLEWADRPVGSGHPFASSVDGRLADALIHRALICRDRQVPEGVNTIGSGAPMAFDRFCPVPMTHLAAFLNGSLDFKRLGRLILAAAMLDRPPRWGRLATDRHWNGGDQPVDPARALLGPFFHAKPLRKETEQGEEARHLLMPSLSWPQKLRAGQTHSVFSEALIRLRAAGYPTGVRPESLRVTLKTRLVASLLIPGYPSEVRKTIGIVCPPAADPTIEEET